MENKELRKKLRDLFVITNNKDKVTELFFETCVNSLRLKTIYDKYIFASECFDLWDTFAAVKNEKICDDCGGDRIPHDDLNGNVCDDCDSKMIDQAIEDGYNNH